jgi:hypothetical protein
VDYLGDVGLKEDQAPQIAALCVPYDGLGYGYTYSDLTQRVLPAILLSAYPDKPIDGSTITEVIKATPPTAPFSESEE